MKARVKQLWLTNLRNGAEGTADQVLCRLWGLEFDRPAPYYVTLAVLVWSGVDWSRNSMQLTTLEGKEAHAYIKEHL